MNVAADPLVQTRSDPEAVDTAGDEGQEEPLDPVAEQLTAGAIKGQTLAIDHSMLHHKLHHVANGPGGRNTAGKGDDQAGNDGIENGIEDAAIPGRLSDGSCVLVNIHLLDRLGLGLCFTATAAEIHAVFQLVATIRTMLHSFHPFFFLF